MGDEKDTGIYDAMNKGTLLATGEWINFMNAGDSFYNTKILSNIRPHLNLKYHLIYGGANYIYENNNQEIFFKDPKIGLFTISYVCHQAAFIKTDLMKKYKYDTSYKIAGDVDFLSKIYTKNSFKKTNIIVVNYDTQGISATPFNITKIKEDWKFGSRIIKGFVFFNLLNLVFRMFPIFLFKKIIPIKYEIIIRQKVKVLKKIIFK